MPTAKMPDGVLVNLDQVIMLPYPLGGVLDFFPSGGSAYSYTAANQYMAILIYNLITEILNGHESVALIDVAASLPVPYINSISPATTSHTGGATMTVTGFGFAPNTKVFINGVAVATTYVSSTSVTFTDPGGTIGPVDVKVINLPQPTTFDYPGGYAWT